MDEDTQRTARVREALEDAKLGALVCRLAENVLLLSGVWPVSGFSTCLVPREGEPVLIVPEDEFDHSRTGWIKDVRTFGRGRVKDRDPYAEIQKVVFDEIMTRGLARRGMRLGIEGSFEFVAPAQRSCEVSVPALPTRNLLNQVSGEAEFVDATGLLVRLRAVKTSREIQMLGKAAEVAGFGLQAFRDETRPGIREVDAAACIEQAVAAKGTGYGCVESAR